MRSALAFSRNGGLLCWCGFAGISDANRMPTDNSLDAMTDCRDTMVISRVQSLLHAVRDSSFQDMYRVGCSAVV